VIATPSTTRVPDESRLISKGTHVTVRHLLFDVDDVISQRQSPGSVTWLAVTVGMNRSDFATIYSRYRSGYELGTSRAGCWPRAVGRDIGRDDLDLQDILSLTRPRVDVLPTLREARANGHDLNLIANVPKPLGSAYDESKSRGSSSAAFSVLTAVTPPPASRPPGVRRRTRGRGRESQDVLHIRDDW
jgi:hypothetical protein